jgi:hypothetical protein
MQSGVELGFEPDEKEDRETERGEVFVYHSFRITCLISVVFSVIRSY